jgi:hypothetical protein
MSNSKTGSTPQSGVIIGSLIGVVLLVAGLWVGFAEHVPSLCGSVLGGSSRYISSAEAIVCDRVLSASTTWTWVLIIAAVVSFVAGLLITVFMKRTEQAPAT